MSCSASTSGCRVLAAILLAAPAALAAEPDPQPEVAPRVRLELSFLAASPLRSKVKLGDEATATGVDLRRDLHLRSPGVGLGVRLDVGVLRWAEVGVVYWGGRWRGPTRHLHYRGIVLRDQPFPGEGRLRTTVDLQYAELSLRLVPLRLPRLRLWLGIGPAHVRMRVRVAGAAGRGRALIEQTLGPALSYELAVRATSWLTAFFGSGITLAPLTGRQAVLTALRLGARARVWGPLEVTVAFGTRSGLLTTWNEQFRREHLTASHRWRRARWSNAALELGIAVGF